MSSLTGRLLVPGPVDQADMLAMSTSQCAIRHSKGMQWGVRVSAHHWFTQDLDGKLRVETVGYFETPQVSETNDTAHDTSSLLGHVVGPPVKTPYIVHRNLRYPYNEEDEKYILLRLFIMACVDK